jgi:hypothetical protein
MPLSSTRIGPSLLLFATETVAPVPDELDDGLALPVEGLDPHAVASKVIKVNAAVASNFVFTQPDTRAGYDMESALLRRLDSGRGG